MIHTLISKEEWNGEILYKVSACQRRYVGGVCIVARLRKGGELVWGRGGNRYAKWYMKWAKSHETTDSCTWIDWVVWYGNEYPYGTIKTLIIIQPTHTSPTEKSSDLCAYRLYKPTQKRKNFNGIGWRKTAEKRSDHSDIIKDSPRSRAYHCHPPSTEIVQSPSILHTVRLKYTTHSRALCWAVYLCSSPYTEGHLKKLNWVHSQKNDQRQFPSNKKRKSKVCTLSLLPVYCTQCFTSRVFFRCLQFILHVLTNLVFVRCKQFI